MSVLRPYSVSGVISPFNFPLALAAGPTAGALVAGNTLVFKPASDTPFVGLRLDEIVERDGIPPGVFNFVTRRRQHRGQELVENPGVNGIVFTGSARRRHPARPRRRERAQSRARSSSRSAAEPGDRHASADLDKASDGVMRSAFGNQGQKCSACSRMYVDRDGRQGLSSNCSSRRRSRSESATRSIGTSEIGPVINEGAVETYKAAIAR